MLEVNRKEIKYALPYTDYYKIRPLLAACMKRDPYDKEGLGYEISSIYFDSLDDEDLQDVLDGCLNKQKIRLRHYPPDTEHFKLEYKCKTDSDGRKKSISLNREEAEKLLIGDNGFLLDWDEETAKEIYARMRCGCYRPKVIVRYQRQAWLHEGNDIRITFDYNVSAGYDREKFLEPEFTTEPVTPSGVGVLEVKYNYFLYEYLKNILTYVEQMQVSNSKYAQARVDW